MKFKQNRYSNCKKAFTLIELLVVIAIISLLSAVVLNSLASARMKASNTQISEDLRQFRIAAELYYNDNHAYPPTSMNYKSVDFAVQDKYQYKQKDSWGNKLSFFVKTAEAAGVSHSTVLCKNFDTVASSLVAKKYLASVPVHPYDNDAKGICYKAVNATTTFAVYAALTTQMSVGGSVINKRTGFIVGDTSSTGLSNLKSQTPSDEEPYPIGTNGQSATDISGSADIIYGIIGGVPGSGGSGGIIINTSSTPSTTCSTGSVYNTYGVCQSLFTGTRVNSASCIGPTRRDPFSDSCIVSFGPGSLGCASLNEVYDVYSASCKTVFTGTRVNSVNCPFPTQPDDYSDTCINLCAAGTYDPANSACTPEVLGPSSPGH